MKERLEALEKEALKQIKAAGNLMKLNEIRVRFLGKKGSLTEFLRGLGNASSSDRPIIGQIVNELREELGRQIGHKQKQLEELELEKKLEEEVIDVTLPGRPANPGHSHPITAIVEEIEDLFISMGYKVEEGPEIETDYYNFEALNLPKDHPARDMQDSFYISKETLLRTQTSAVQPRTMEKFTGEGSLKIICPGKVYRRDNDDATHSHQFMQIEGLCIAENISMSDLKGTLDVFVRKIFGKDRKIRLRPSYFPFTEPTVEVDVSCLCSGKGCSICKKTGWIEILGAGMVHPNVLEKSGIDSKKFSGFAFGMGPERIAMLKYGIDDIRHFYTNDIRFLKQFNRA